jgi:Fe-S-cluster containining protein
MTDPGGPIDAGAFGAWLDGMAAALAGEVDADVACGTCTACCASSQFVHVAPDEADALAHIPRDLLFPAPGLPRGHVLMGYDDQGRCPMLTDDGCSIYEHRPRTCRTYDCRVFPAAGVTPDDKPRVAERAARWRFTYEAPDDEARHAAVRAAAAAMGDGAAPTEVAVRAVSVVIQPS